MTLSTLSPRFNGQVTPHPAIPHFGNRGGSNTSLTPEVIKTAFQTQNLTLNDAQITLIQSKVEQAVALIRTSPQESQQIGFLAVSIANMLNINAMMDTEAKTRIEKALKAIAQTEAQPTEAQLAWTDYFRKTIDLNRDRGFLELVRGKGYSPVKISWEDIARDKGSSVGSRISDVGIWVRKDEADPQSAELALSVRRDQNFRDKVLVVPAENIKVHTKAGRQTREVSLPDRLKELGLTSQNHDSEVIVSNQFAVVPVPSKEMKGVSKEGKPPRTGFAFSIYPYGSSNFVITDVIEGSSNAVVGPGNHQLLYANVNGNKAPFTASRAEDRKDLLRMEQQLKAQGMDVDVQRYYLIQIPLKKDPGIQLSNMGNPPISRGGWMGGLESMGPDAYGGATSFATKGIGTTRSMRGASRGLDRVAIGHGETEGKYNEGGGYSGQRADEPIRVTAVYFVTPKGQVTEKDMEAFSQTFEQWDKQAIWGGSFVVPEAKQ